MTRFLCVLCVLCGGLLGVAQAQSACPSTGWGQVWNSPDTRAIGTGSTDNSWNGVPYMNSVHQWYRWLTDKDSLTPNDNAIGFYSQQTNCSLTTNPWTLTTITGGSQTGYSPPGTYNYYAGVGFNGSSLCDGAPATKDSTTLCLAGVESRNFTFSNCTTNGSGAGSCGAYLIDGEVVEYGSITRSTADGTHVLLGNLVRGSRTAAGNPDCSGTACNHSVQSPVTRYVFVVSPTAAQATPGNGGMKVDVGAGLAAVPSGGDVPWLRHSSRAALWDNNAGRMWQLGGWLDGPSFQDLWYRCVPGATSSNGKCDATKIAQGWIRVNTPTYLPKAHYETAAVYYPEHDAIFSYGSDATNDMWVYSDATNATIGSTGGDLKQLTITCQNSSGGTIACPIIGAQKMVWDPDDHLIMMFGGRSGATRYDNIVVYNPANTTVSGIPGRTLRILASANLGCSSTGQSVCYLPAFTYDTTSHISVVYAGPGQLLKYTYAASGGTWANTGVSGGPPAPGTNTQVFPDIDYAPDLDMYLYAASVSVPNRTDTWQLPGATISAGSVPGSGTKYSGMTLQGVEIQ